MFQDRTSKLRAGSVLTASEEGFVPTIDCGAMISRDRFEGLEAIISSAQRAGALVSAEMGKGWKHSYHEHGCYFHPTVVGNVTPEMDIAQHERTLKMLCLGMKQAEVIIPQFLHPLRYSYHTRPSMKL